MVFRDFCILIHYVTIFLHFICEVGETGIIFQPKEREKLSNLSVIHSLAHKNGSCKRAGDFVCFAYSCIPSVWEDAWHIVGVNNFLWD